MKKICILGSTGSIGTQALDVVERNSELFEVESLTCGTNIDLFRTQLKKYSPAFAVTALEEDAKVLKKEFPKIDFSYGLEGMILAAAGTDCDLVLNSLMGMMGLRPTYEAIRAKKNIALANKETLVAGGAVIMEAVKKNEVQLLPVDSEHSAIFQCLQGNRNNAVHRILLTASGGPFRGYTSQALEEVTLEQALHHPKWVMGNKITIDSASLMNKGLEIIEAHWLFDVPAEKIQVVVHPQSVIHSMIEFKDRSILAQLGMPDMRGPISYAFGFPNRIENTFESVDFFKLGTLTFEEADTDVFSCLRLAYDALEAGGSYPVALNAANEVLVQKFLDKKIKFTDIQNNLEIIMQRHKPMYHLTLDDILDIDAQTRTEILI
ncbi:1-deoxy-D-xylulose-5-phosphate reductoisomerase [Sinanaerobacter sp. ZZT-01]|uniref:1-deoxy-D-xylulose-5-phosphate reductoisomerase n=1 Tax=Sinanaerobacter sp. ZZT-01 TaxID=3111540 RepID=UPI002D792AC0|nr:1-deoxy-D-xylulose-5-phosphate reductoisomerase [Sinanaerobacter sp. ZZT-01]WRR93244.1 1-deoxy-D-xylulose-5-phosphate reductoisomerase [Sinanaerobacter sp. ZZT-01]